MSTTFVQIAGETPTKGFLISPQTNLSYGEHLWDNLYLIQIQSENRAKQMRALKSFFKNYQEILATFQSQLGTSIKKLKQDLDLPFFKDGKIVKTDETWGSLKHIGEMRGHCEGMLQFIEDKSNQIQVDMVDGLDLYEKHYSKETKVMLKEAQEIWDKAYQDRTHMLWSKEEYLSSMHTYSQLQAKVEDVIKQQKSEEEKLKRSEQDIIDVGGNVEDL